MRILFHGPHPDMPTGYSNQAATWVPRIAAAGHEVGISCTAGVVRFDTEWRGHKVYGRSPYTDMAEDLVGFNYEDFGADMVITLCCPWKLHGPVWKPLRTVHLMPVDREPLGGPDYKLLAEGGGMPAAVSRFGERVLRARGLDPVYLPHAVDTGIWTPPENRRKLRQAQGIDHMFTVGVNASNTDPGDRKQFFELFAGFARFRAKHPRSLLMVHAARAVPDGLNLPAMRDHVGLPADAVVFSDLKQAASHGASEQALAAWYGTLDVLAQLGNEGYGLPAAQAMACGTPVIAGEWSTGPELAGPTGWLVKGQQRWNDGHQAAWHVPFITSVASRLTMARDEAGDRREAARRYAVAALDADRLFEEHWAPFLKEAAG